MVSRTLDYVICMGSEDFEKKEEGQWAQERKIKTI
jgi:hypothetical protein